MAGRRRIGELRAACVAGALGALVLMLLLAPAAPAQDRMIYATEGVDGVVLGFAFDRQSGAVAQVSGVEEALFNPRGITASPDGRHLFVAANNGSEAKVYTYAIGAGGSLTPGGATSLNTSQLIESIAIAPDGRRLYVGLSPGVACYGSYAVRPRRCLAASAGHERSSARRGGLGFGDVAVVDVSKDGTLTPDPGAKSTVEAEPETLTVTPDGKTLVIAGPSGGRVAAYRLDGTGAPTWIETIPNAGFSPALSAVTPDGKHVYVLGSDGSRITYGVATDGSLEQVEAMQQGEAAFGGVAMAPGGDTLYSLEGTGAPLDYAVRADPLHEDGTIWGPTMEPVPFPQGDPTGMAISPDDRNLFVLGGTPTSELVGYRTRSDDFDLVSGAPLTPTHGDPPVPAGTGGANGALAIVPDQGPRGDFSAFQDLGSKGGPSVSFDASASTDPDGRVAKYRWDFGDGHKRTTSDPEIEHRYQGRGRHTVKLRVVDDEGCSNKRVFTGQIALCNGSKVAVAQAKVTIGDVKVERPRIKARSPQRVRGKRIAVKLRAGAAEPVKVAARAKVRIKGVKRAFKTKRVSRRAKAGKLARLTLRVKGKRAARLLKRRHKGTARVTVRITDRAGNSEKLRRRVKLKR